MFVWDAASTAADDGGVTIAVTGVATGRWVRLLDGFVTPEMFGAADFAAVQDGYSKNIVAYDAAYTVDSVLQSPAVNLSGNDYTLSHTTSNAGRAINTPYFDAENIDVRGAFFDGAIIDGGRRLAISENVTASKISLYDCKVDFKSVVNPETGLATDEPGNVLFRFVDTANQVASISIDNCEFYNSFWGFLKSNPAVSSESNIRITNSTFDDFSSIALLFNSPAVGSSIENVSILNVNLGSNNSRQEFGLGTGFPHRGSFAGNVSYAKLIASHGYGNGSELFRAEESASNVIMALNTAKLNGKDGIEIIPNNVGGVNATPKNFVVLGNVLNHASLVSAPTAGWGIGLYTYEQVVGNNVESIHNSLVSGNVLVGFDYGIYAHSGMQRNFIESNIIVDCEDGIQTHSPSLGIRGNMIVDPTGFAVDFQKGGMIGGLSLRSANPIPTAATVNNPNCAGVLSKWDWETGLFAGPSAGTTEYPIIEIGNRISGVVKVVLTRDQFYACVIGNLSYDGTTLTFTESLRTTDGSPTISATPFSVVAGQLNVRIFESTESRPGCRLQVSFDGLHVFHP